MREHQVEPRSVVLFFALLSAFIVILTLRAHLLAPATSSAVAAVQAASQTSLTAKASSLRDRFLTLRPSCSRLTITPGPHF
jgi:hypothetical protein